MKDLLKWVMYGALFVIPFVLLVVSGEMFFPYITGKNFYFRIFVELALGSWLLLALLDKAYRPRWSWVLGTIATLVSVMFVANIFGEYAPKSFWSNYERMEGWVTLVHFFAYFVVLGSVLTTEKMWSWFLHTSLVAGVFMSFYALGQVAGVYEVSQGNNWRIDGRLGNSSYLGVYMLFQMFVAGWLFLRAKSLGLRCTYGALIVAFGYLLAHTGTRGTTLGLVLGTLLGFIYLSIMAPKGAVIKKWALGGVLATVLIVGGLVMARDTAFVQNNEILSRVVGITWAEGGIRFAVWKMALEGVKERPILGWGQENFNYVFNKYYDPYLYRAEIWYDRTHNIFMDWLIAGGVLGLLAYLSVAVMALWYSVLTPLITRFKKGVIDKSNFTVTEQALILSLFTAYMFHNLVVFDNLASWIFYAVVLALIHSRSAQAVGGIENFSVDKKVWSQVLVPSVIVVTLAVVYFVNAPGILASKDIINAYRATDPIEKIDSLQNALNRRGFAEQEIVEQMLQMSGQLLASEAVTADDKEKIKAIAETAMDDLIAEKSGDTRLHVVYASYFQSIDDLNRAWQELEIAHTLSPQKQAIIEQQAIVFLVAGEYDTAVQYFKQSYDLDQTNSRGRVYYAVGALYAGDDELFEELIDFNELKMREGPGEIVSRERVWSSLVNEQFALQSAYRLKNYDLLLYILSERVKLYPDNSEMRTNLAAAYYEMGDKEKAIAVIEKAITEIPAFRDEGERLIKGLRSE